MEELIFSVEAHSSKELRHFKFISVSFMAQLLGSASFIGKVNDAPPLNTDIYPLAGTNNQIFWIYSLIFIR